VLIEVDVAGVDREAGLEALRGHVVPGIRQLPGFRSGTCPSGNEHDRALGGPASVRLLEIGEHGQHAAVIPG
jgi:hypothetical protein